MVINREPPCTRSGVADVETYIHRSGRTGRAGKKGICITFHTGQIQEQCLKSIEKAVGNTFIRIGVPQPEDLLRAKVHATIERVKTEGIYESVYKIIAPEVETMLAEQEKSGLSEEQRHNRLVKMISSFIGIGLGCDQPLNHRSLQSGTEGMFERVELICRLCDDSVQVVPAHPHGFLRLDSYPSSLPSGAL